MLGNKFYTFLPLFIIAILLVSAKDSYSTHAAGADLTYEHLGGNTYKFQYTFYRACENGSVGAPGAVSLSISSNSCNINTTTILSQDANSKTDITPLCSSAQSKCNGGPYVGYEKYTYTKNVTLTTQCADYEFAVCHFARNNGIQTIIGPGGQSLCVTAGLNNLAFNTNSSSSFTNDPIGFICTNQNFCFNHGAIDLDGDLLVYELATPLTLSNGSSGTLTPVVYKIGFSKNNPLTGTTNFNTSNGDLCFNASAQQISVVAVKVKEYRNGQLVGYTTRDIQLYTLNCSNNLPELSGIDGVMGSSASSLTVCAGQPVNFNINSNDGNGDNLTMSWNNGIPNASFNISGNPFPSGSFSWTPTQADAGAGGHCFTVTVKDNHCPYYGSSTRSYCIYVQAPDPKISAAGPFCVDASAQNLSANPSGGTWSGNGIINSNLGTFNPSVAGVGSHNISYSYTDGNGCSGTDNITIQVTPTPIVNAGINQNSCNANSISLGGTPTASGGTPGYQYNWSPASNLNNPNSPNPIVTNISNTTYQLTVTDNNGCKGYSSVTVGVSNIQLSASVTDASCNGTATGSITLSASGGNGSYTYNWSNGANGNVNNNLLAGTYTVTVQDASGCTKTQSFNVGQPSAMQISASTSDVGCHGAATGSITVSANGGSGSFNYSWSNGLIGSSISGLSAGAYTVTINDAKGCQKTQTFNLNEPSALQISGTIVDVACSGSSSGSINSIASGGTPGYAYSWSNGSLSSNIQNLTAGSYSLTVTDANNCSSTQSFTVNQSSALSVQNSVSHVSCNGGSNGSINLQVNGGNGGFSYLWGNGATTQNLSNIGAGNHLVTVTDNQGCTNTQTINVSEPAAVSLAHSTVDVSCHGGNNGSVTLTATGGVGNFNYSWPTNAGPQSGNIGTNLSFGNYTVTVTDGNSCSSQIGFQINEPAQLQVTGTSTDVNCAGDSSGAISLITSGGVAAYSYAWNNGQNSNTISNLPAGSYSVTITDANNCVLQTAYQINQNTQLTVQNTTVDVSCNGVNDGIINITVGGGVSGYSYTWSNGQTTQNLSSIAGGTYSLTVTDSKNCKSIKTYVINEPNALALQANTSMPLCNGDSTGQIQVNASGGTQPYSYTWSSNNSGSSISGIPAGNYFITITDDNNCLFHDSILIVEPSSIQYNVLTTDVLCNGDSTGSASINSAGGTGTHSYQWLLNSGNQSGAIANQLAAGSYSVIVTDSNNCQSTAYFQINQPFQLVDSIGKQDVTCYQGNDGLVQAFISGGITPYQFAWSTGATANQIDSLIAGSYQLTVTDDNGCAISSNVVIQDGQSLQVNISGPSSICFGESAQLVVQHLGGTYSEWNTGTQGDTLVVQPTQSGTYFVNVLNP
ncbi:MAG: hypothetical protein MRY83_12355, partial [Flavobacteriales bacterium]|nr:hypothetical protein [Flavobacteriales bacterium]